MLCGILVGGLLFAQEKTVTGNVTDSDGFPLSDVSVTSSSGEEVFTDLDGNYSISVNQGDELTIESLGLDIVKVTVGTGNVYNAQLRSSGAIELEGIVVTALGITRDEKALGYSSQKVDGDLLAASRNSNALNALSGNVAGVQIKNPSSNLGGSTRMTMRGISSLTGENRPLIVIDGIPMNNSNFNTTAAQRGSVGRDYGDMGADINPDDIQSINVLKGGPAATLYGSLGANGVILITTKKAKKGRDEIVINTGISVDQISLFPKLQKQYGGGGSDTFDVVNINGTDYNIVDYGTDESWGPKYDPNVSVLQWNAFDPEFPNDYLTPTPWVYPKNDVKTFFKNGVTYTNSVSFSKSYENTTARMSISNIQQSGIVPNSELKRTSVQLGLENKFNDKLTATGNFNYIRTDGLNRPEVGYSSIVTQFFHFGQLSLDYSKLKDYEINGRQRTWNRTGWDDPTGVFADNPYWSVNNINSHDRRDRFYGNTQFKYNFTENLYAVGTIYADYYGYNVNEQVAIGSFDQTSMFSQTKRDYTNMNYEGRLHFDKTFGNFSLNSFIGVNRKHETRSMLYGTTNGGLVVPGIYNLGNSVDSPLTQNSISKKRINSVFGAVSLGYSNSVFVDFAGRNDWSSALPADNNSYFYPAVTGSIVFSEWFEKNDILNYGKIRGGWSQVRNDTDPYSLANVFVSPPAALGNSFLGDPAFTNESTRKNPFLKPELITTWEVGIEAEFLKRRILFDVTYYDKQTDDLIVPVQVDASTGWNNTLINAGKMSNKGIEAMLTIVPVRSNNFDWRVSGNFSKNKNEVLELYGDLENIVIGSAPFKAQVVAALGEEYGQIRGTDFVYDDQGNKVVNEDGLYLQTQAKNLGSVLPDWNLGIRNTFRYKNVGLSILLDIQKGGKYFSTSNLWSMYSGMAEETAANGVRENGIVVPGVTGDVTFNPDGSYSVTNTNTNTTVTDGEEYFRHFYSGPTAQNVFNADYIKLREITLSYTLPDKFNGPFQKVEISAFARNLFTWGLDNKNYDPEMATMGSGNLQGIEGGALPPVRTIGMNVKLQF